MDLKTVSFEQAQSLKDLGFPQKNRDYDKWYSKTGTIDNYTNLDTTECFAPSLELTSKWLREEKKIWIRMDYKRNSLPPVYVSTVFKDSEFLGTFSRKTYDEALAAGVDKAIEILK